MKEEKKKTLFTRMRRIKHYGHGHLSTKNYTTEKKIMFSGEVFSLKAYQQRRVLLLLLFGSFSTCQTFYLQTEHNAKKWWKNPSDFSILSETTLALTG